MTRNQQPSRHRFRGRSAWVKAAALATIGVLVVASCGSDDGDSADSSPPSESSADSSADSDVTDPSAAPGSEATSDTAANTDPAVSTGSAPATADDACGADVDETNTLRLGLETGFLGWDPVTSVAGRDPEVLFLIYDRLIHVDPTDGALVPGLATEWEFAPDNSYLELTLREGVEFHDGTPFDADAVKQNLDRAMTLEGSARKADLATIDSVEVVDPYTVRLMLNAPAQTLPTILSNREGAMVSPTLFNSDPDFGQKTAVGTGPFVLEDNQLTVSANMVRNENYWDPDAVHLAGIDLTVMADATTRLNAIRSGEMDAVGVTSSQIGEAEDAGLDITKRDTTQLYMIYLNRSLEPLGDVRVRQALNYAIDREAIVEFLLFDEAKVAWQFYNDFDAAYVPELENSYPYDPDKARALLAEAGYADGFDITATTYSERPFELQLATVIQSQLAEIGVNVELLPLDRASIIETFFTNAETNIFPALFTGRNTPEQAAGALFTDGGSLNSGNVVDERVQAAYDEAIGSTTPEARDAALQEMGIAISEEALTVPIAFTNVAFAATNGVTNLFVTPAGQLDARSACFAN